MALSVLELFILSQFDRGLETPYDLQRQAGVSLGSSIPALRRLETAGLIKKRPANDSSKRLRHSYQLSESGRRLAKKGWIPAMKDQPVGDFDAVLRLADLATHYKAKTADIATLLEGAAKYRVLLSRQASSGNDQDSLASLRYAVTRKHWEVGRLAAEAKFLFSLAKSASSVGRNKSTTA